MVTLCWAAKGGSGTTVVACVMAVESQAPTLLVDLGGDASWALGVAPTGRPGVADWLTSDAPADHLADLLLEVGGATALLPQRLGDPSPPVRKGAAERWQALAVWLERWARQSDGLVIVDCGTGHPHDVLLDAADERLLVTRPCYLALSRARASGIAPTGVVLVDDPGRSLCANDVVASLGAPIVATVDHDPAIARAVDAGLLHNRLPRTVRRQLHRAA